jgi:regulator of RNase E activity RraA
MTESSTDGDTLSSNGNGPAGIDSDVIARYRFMSPCTVSDSLAAVGAGRLALDGIITVDLNAKIVGPAFTVTCEDAATSTRKRIDYMPDILAGSVVVIANQGRLDASVWGGQRTVAARYQRAEGTVADGAYRDIPEHIAMNYPVFARGRTIVASQGYSNPVAIQETVQIGDVSVSPGDLVVGDASGVVVVPAAHIEEVLVLSEAGAAKEAWITAEVEAGRNYFEARDASGGIR